MTKDEFETAVEQEINLGNITAIESSFLCYKNQAGTYHEVYRRIYSAARLIDNKPAVPENFDYSHYQNRYPSWFTSSMNWSCSCRVCVWDISTLQWRCHLCGTVKSNDPDYVHNPVTKSSWGSNEPACDCGSDAVYGKGNNMHSATMPCSAYKKPIV